MHIPIFVEPVEQNGYRAKSGEPLALSVEAATREEAIAKLREQLTARLQNGGQLVSLELTEQPAFNPWVEFAGMFNGDPVFEKVVQIMQENRKKEDEDPDFL